MRRLLEWWSDLTLVLTDPEVLTVLTIVGGLLALATLALYSIWRWRVEKAFVEMEIRDVLARVDHYAAVSPGPASSSAAAGRRQEYLQELLERWMHLQYELWTDFQVYLAWRATASIPVETSRCTGQLAAGFRQMLAELWGSPDKLLAAA